LPVALRAPLFGAMGRLWPASRWLPGPLRLKTYFENLAVSDAEAFYRDLIWLRPDTREALYTPDFMRLLKGFTPLETVAPYYCENDAIDALGRSQYTDIHFYMTDDVLAKVDRMSMAHSLEVRCPLLDFRLLEFAARLPRELKIKSRQGKLLIRALARQRLPQAVHRAPKRGFAIPAATWLRNELRPLAESVLLEGNGLISLMLNRQTVVRLWGEHLSGARDHSVSIWGLMMLGLWERATRARSSGQHMRRVA
jgi:asparagine synthase (glutamine-hydrolysing)